MCLPKGEGKRDFVVVKIDMLDLNLESFIDLEETQECNRIYGLSKTSDHRPSPGPQFCVADGQADSLASPSVLVGG